MATQTVDNYINGQWVPPTTGNYLDVTSPHDGSVIGRVALSGSGDVEAAVQAGEAAYAKWSQWTVKERAKCLLRLRHIVEQRENELVDSIMKEHGKNRVEAIGEVRKGNETVEYAGAMPELIPGRMLEVSNGVECKEYRMSHGVVASVVPFNFPVMVPLWTLPIAVACGNCYILKPSEKVPMSMAVFMSMVEEAGFPAGVIQIVNGAVDAVTALCDHPRVKALSFVGSSRVAELVAKRCRNLSPPKRVLALGGAKNHLIASPDCNIDMTSTDVLNSFCGCSGQRCMAASALLIVGKQQALLDAIVQKASALVPGTEKRQLGPLIDQAAQDRCARYVTEAEKGGAKILVDGRKWVEQKQEGFFFGPTVILHSNRADPALHDEIFGPILSILEVPDRETAIQIENGNPYGNAACIYTTTGATADWYQRRLQAGMIGVNIGVPVPREPFAFGGTNLSKFGEFDITADGGIEFWTWRKKVTTKWVPPQNKTWMD